MAAGLAERVADLIRGVTTKFSANWVSTLTSGRLQVRVAATLGYYILFPPSQNPGIGPDIRIPLSWQNHGVSNAQAGSSIPNSG